ncbi:MAG: PQQ-binding-like beta-propeller repeat protein [Bryobacteraceae bacterium]
MRMFMLFLTAALALASDWPQWRGPTADGISSDDGVPTRWSKSENVVWKAPLPGLGTSTPIVLGNRVFVTSQTGDGPFEGRGRDFEGATEARKSGDGPVRFNVHAFDRATGKELWKHSMAAEGPLQPVHLKHNLASPSCVTDGERVYAWFGTGQLTALSLDGKPVWSRHLGKEFGPFDILWGHGSSATLYKGSLLLLVDHPPGAYLLSVDARTGKDRWRTDRGKDRRSYTTPFVIRAGDHDELILNTNDGVEAVDPVSGKPLWKAGEANRVPVPTPVYHEGILYVNRGYTSSPYLALRPGGKIEWEIKTGAPYVSSLLYHDGLLYMANERGVVSVANAANGASIWKDRFGGVFSASPVAAGGHVYLSAEDGTTYVLAAGKEKKVIAENSLGERTLASLAIAGGRIFIRTDQHLYCIGKN